MPRRADKWDNFIFDVRTRGMRSARWAVIIIVVLALGAVAYVGIRFYTMVAPNVPSMEKVTEDIPLNSLAAAYIEVADCARQGPDVCTDYAEAKSFMVAASMGKPVTYQGSGPGEDIGNGERTFTLSAESSDQDVQAYATAVTLNGQANPSTVTEVSAKKVSDSAVTFSVQGEDGKPKIGRIDFAKQDSDIRISEITYTDAG